jgi:CHAT domain-containing protein
VSFDRCRRRAWIAIAAIATLSIVLAIGWRFKGVLAIRSLSTASGFISQREIEARLADFPYARLKLDKTDLRLRRVTAKLLVLLPHSVDTLHARALAELLEGHSTAAIELLKAATQNENDAAIWNDLAAAHCEEGRKQNAPEEYAAALAAANRALKLDPQLPEAAFNRALALERLGLESSARRAYTQYFSTESNDWAGEARRRTLALTHATEADVWRNAQRKLERACSTTGGAAAASLVRQFPQRARSWAESEYLARWAEASLRDDHVADQWLRIARCIGKVLSETSKEHLLADSVDAIDRAIGRGTARPLAKAYLDYRTARIRYSERRVTASESLFIAAANGFASAHSPMYLVARYYGGSIAFDRNATGVALQRFDDVANAAASKYRSLHAQIEWGRALALASRGCVYEALQATRSSIAIFDGLNERDNGIRMRTSEASLLASMGRSSEAWRVRTTLFLNASRSGSTPLIVEAMLSAAAGDELREEHWDIAAALFDEQSKLPSASPLLRVEAIVGRAVANDRGGNTAATLDDLREAYRAAAGVPDPALRDAATDKVRTAEAILSIESHPDGAERLLTQTIEKQERSAAILDLPEAYLGRARARRRLAKTDDATRDLIAAIDLLERAGESIRRNALRDSFFGGSSAPYEELVDLHAQRGQFREAFVVADRSRARWLFDRVRERGSCIPEPLFVENIQRRLPPDTLLLHFTTLPERVVAVGLTAKTIRGLTLHATRSEIEAWNRSLIAAIERGDDAAAQLSGARLFDALIAPFKVDTWPTTTMVIVPDDTIASIPMAALFDRSAGRYLIETRKVTFAASATAYTHLCDRDAISTRKTERALIIGDPAFDSAQFATLAPLTSARREALRIAREYSKPMMLVGPAATRGHVLAAIGAADVVHFGCHALVNERDPALSLLAFAPSGSDRGSLYLPEIADLALPNEPIVILAGCQTAVASAGHGSVRSIALAFLAAGSRSVVGSLWNVDDDTTMRLSLEIHRQLRAGIPVASALRAAQLGMLRSTAPKTRALRAWSGFQVYGID